MNTILGRVVEKLRLSYFPNAIEKEVARWYSDDADENRRYDYDLNSDSLVLDLGGYKGQFASDIYARYNCRVLVFEPVNSFAEKIRARFKRNAKIEVFCYALGSKSRQETIALRAEGSSLYRDSSQTAVIRFVDVKGFFDAHNIQHVDLMKINIEGGEYELMQALFAAGLVDRIKQIQIQFHEIAADSEVQMDGICRELSKTHSPTYRYKFIWENWARHD